MSTLTLRVTEKDGHLDVHLSGTANQIAHGLTVTIIWQLTGNAASGSFNVIDNTSSSGLRWDETPTSGVFNTATLYANGNEIRVTDNNNDPNGVSSVGEWIYTLNATVAGKARSTVYNSKKKTMNNPTIKNM
jgi:hypothetical protein